MAGGWDSGGSLATAAVVAPPTERPRRMQVNPTGTVVVERAVRENQERARARWLNHELSIGSFPVLCEIQVKRRLCYFVSVKLRSINLLEGLLILE